MSNLTSTDGFPLVFCCKTYIKLDVPSWDDICSELKLVSLELGRLALIKLL
jgi:hypothetical protein